MNEQFLRQQLAITEQQRNGAMSAAAQASAAVDLANTTIKRLQERIEKMEKSAVVDLVEKYKDKPDEMGSTEALGAP